MAGNLFSECTRYSDCSACIHDGRLIEYSGHLKVRSSLLNVIVRE
jgi:hypothetical protein